MRDFAAIDFETANNERTSVCSVGVVIVRNGEIVDSFYSLIQPEPNYYNYWCSQVHGLTRQDTEDAPIFPEVWKQIEPLIEGLPLVAHNKAFDEVHIQHGKQNAIQREQDVQHNHFERFGNRNRFALFGRIRKEDTHKKECPGTYPDVRIYILHRLFKIVYQMLNGKRNN